MVCIVQGNAIMCASKKVKPTYYSSFEFYNAIKYNSDVELLGKQIGQTYITFNLTIYTAPFSYRNPSQKPFIILSNKWNIYGDWGARLSRKIKIDACMVFIIF